MPTTRILKKEYHDRTLRWRALQADAKLRTDRFLTLQQLASTARMSKQAVRYYCLRRGIPYEGFGAFGHFPTAEEIRRIDEENGLAALMDLQNAASAESPKHDDSQT